MLRRSGQLDVAVSVVNHELREGLRACLLSLPPACEGLGWRATVVDNVSRDGSLEMLETEFGCCSVIRNQARLGFGANHNQVLERALEAREARYVLVLNNDTELEPGSVAELVQFMDSQPGVGAASPRMLSSAGERHDILFRYPSVAGHLRWSLRPTRRASAAVGRPGWLNGACLLLRAQALEEVGVFDTRFFMFFEDTDLQARLRDAGWSSAICDRASVVHQVGQTVKKPELRLAMECQLLRSRYLYFLKHHGLLQAKTVAWTTRLVLSARAGKLVLERALGRPRADADGGLHALLELARYDPRSPLRHELAEDAYELSGGQKG